MDARNTLERLALLAVVAALPAAGGVLASGAQGPPPPPPAPVGPCGTPNVLVILIDDLGPEQLDCYDPSPTLQDACCPPLGPGGTNLWAATPAFEYAPTPNITRLAQKGVRFTRAFASQICSPSRAQLLSGSYPFRTGIGTIVFANGQTKGKPVADQQLDFDPSLLTIGEMMLEGSSHSAAYFGKWHLGRDQLSVQGSVAGQVAALSGSPLNVPSFAHPAIVGWPFFRGIMGNPDRAPMPANGSHDLWYRVTNAAHPNPSLPPAVVSVVESTVWATSQQREDLETWIVNQPGPWFAVWSPSACHSPFDNVDNTNQDNALLHGYPSAGNSDFMLSLRQMLEAFDSELGLLEDHLDAVDPAIWANTVVVLLGDNGTDPFPIRYLLEEGPDAGLPYYSTNPSAATPATAANKCLDIRFKGSPYITGTGVPLIVSGPCVVDPGRTCDDLADIVDIYATVRDIVGVDPAVHTGFALDSRSLLPAIENVSSAATRRTTSLALMYRPNGPIENHDGLRMGFTMVLDAASGVDHPGTYRLIRYRQDGCALTEDSCYATCAPPDEFYRTHDEVVTPGVAALPDDILELNPLVYDDGNGATVDPYADEYAAVIAALHALSPEIQP